MILGVEGLCYGVKCCLLYVNNCDIIVKNFDDIVKIIIFCFWLKVDFGLNWIDGR